MNFKSLILAATLGLTTLGVVPEAQAGLTECVTRPTFRLCFQQVGLQGTYNTWNLTVTNRYWTEHMQVVCNDKRMDNWSSRGGASQKEAHLVAQAFCEL